MRAISRRVGALEAVRPPTPLPLEDEVASGGSLIIDEVRNDSLEDQGLSPHLAETTLLTPWFPSI